MAHQATSTADDHGATGEAETRVLIHGSCVSRDTFEVLPGSFRLLTYVARQSWVSAGVPAEGVAGRLKQLPSAFQDRVVRGDVRGDLLEVLERLAGEIDVVLVDLVDERGGVVSVGGGYVTKLSELWSAGGAAATSGGRHVAFGTDEHFALWSAAVERVAARLRALDLFDKVIVLRTPWASDMPSGAKVPVPGWMTPPDVANEQYERYFARLAEVGFEMIRLPDELAQSTETHKWGPSPFHYTDEAYAHLAGEIRARVEARRRSAHAHG
ncbi:MAG TPA: DUF6270 domain-containing protein [Intrasporangium sp.]|uniref:DUF6270 domain-containing protein n=1 Tax=Intrasporangium sp. TaxID=1925024 RepID=UPI002D767CE9|nr:DUF6270 domain-containing protein [Intrasporangium sp.]HET7397099.1 DUF6270 domain-containing protein [Intrasporangium sp.]